jgi:dTDP-4-dehydrorhamnose reductase
VNILLLGKNGQLGWELQRTLAPLGPVTALDYPEIDFADSVGLVRAVDAARPQVIINSAAYTDVDKAESERDKAFAINATAPRVLAERARDLDALLIHYSTDYVFDGSLGRPHTEQDATRPLNVYGMSKLAGEEAVRGAGGAYLILRTAWLYSLRGNSFVNKVMQWARKHETLRIVDDQVSNPTWARQLAEISAQVLVRVNGDLGGRAGLYHLAGDGFASRFEWAKAILVLDPKPDEHKTQDVKPAKTPEIPTPAERPLYSALNCDKFAETFGLRLPPWKAALRMAMERG